MLIMRYFLLLLVVMAIAAPICRLVFPLDIEETEASLELAESSFDALLTVIPDNLVDAFATANTPQLLLCAFVLGNVLLALGDRMSRLTVIIRQINDAGLTIAQWVSNLVPYVTGLFLCISIWNDELDLLTDLWKPLLLSVAISIVVFVIFLLVVCALENVSPRTLATKLAVMAIPVFKMGSIDYSLYELGEMCEDNLGISSSYAKAAIPQGLNLYTPVSALGAFVFMVFVAYEQRIPVDTMWTLRLIVITTALFVATPPVTGANLLAYVAFFPILGIADTALMDGMIFDIVFSAFANAFNLATLQLETIMQADHAGALDMETLRKPLEAKSLE